MLYMLYIQLREAHRNLKQVLRIGPMRYLYVCTSVNVAVVRVTLLAMLTYTQLIVQ